MDNHYAYLFVIEWGALRYPEIYLPKKNDTLQYPFPKKKMIHFKLP